jgi:hypothetical protein
MSKTKIARGLLVAAAMLGSVMTAADATPDYGLLTTIAIPASSANNQGGNLTAFDISYVDPVTGYYYFADRSNGAVDIVNGANQTFVAQAGVGDFGGQQSSTAKSGPDGVVVVDNGTTATLYAGNGNPTASKSSELLSFNVTNPSSPTLLNTLGTGGINRVDEMTYSPAFNLLMVANNADTPSFATLVNATTPVDTIAKGNITIPGQPASGGMEQSVWDPKTNSFFVSIPTLTSNPNDPGGVAEISPSGTVLRTIGFASLGVSSCSPAGIGLGGSGNLMVGCGNAKTQTIVLNPAGTGSIVSQIAGVSGTDELWYDPVTKNFYVTGVDPASGDRIIAVISDSTYSILQSIDLTSLGAGTVNAHSVAVDPLNGDIFVPLEGSAAAGGPDALCPGGCVAVFAQVPEPATLPLVMTALLGVFTLSSWRRLGSRRFRSIPIARPGFGS